MCVHMCTVSRNAQEKIFLISVVDICTSERENITDHHPHHGGHNYAEEQAPPVRTRMLQAGTKMTCYWHTFAYHTRPLHTLAVLYQHLKCIGPEP